MKKKSIIHRVLLLYASEQRKMTNELFFKTEKGEYGAHDRFLGVTNPDVRKVAQQFKDISFAEIQDMIASHYNEERLCALIILVARYKRSDKEGRAQIYRFYKKNLRFVNNWNLVDLSVPHIMGEYLVEHKKEWTILQKLVISPDLWRRRIAIIASWAFIKKDDFRFTLRLAKQLLQDEEDLMHKAVGWMLREVGKRDQKTLEVFLDTNITKMPRTTLRYAIERFPEKKRLYYLHK